MSCDPCSGTLSALSVLPQVLPCLLPNDIGPFRSPAGYGGALPEGVGAEGLALARRAVACRQGASAGTPLRGYPSHCASLVGPSL